MASRQDQGELIPFAREVTDVPVDAELGESFLAYSLSVITSRAIPDVRDGLKPVQRRILYSMREMGLRPDRPHRKCAHVVGDVMAKFHPHGDSAIYDTLVRLGQDFARPVTLIDPQGNFGSLDDPPAAYRYTECRLTPAALDLLAEIDEETVAWRPTYDGETVEPEYLPGLLPNLLVNGTSGIAVGMATNMATNNLGEVFEAIKLVMTKRRPRPTIDELLAVLPGPDFPSGGTVIDEGIRDAYESGRGTIRIRAKATVIDVTRSRKGLEITELPYLVGPERVITKVKELMNAGRLDGVADIKNLSDRHSGLKLVIEAKPAVNPQVLLEQLYRLTPLEETFGINNVVLVEGVPTTLGLYDLCRHYIEHRMDVVVKRSEYRLRKAQERLHLVEGLLIAIDNIDRVVAIIRSSGDTPEARSRLMEELTLSEIQAEYVLELRLRRLTALAYDELVAEKAELLQRIKELEKILGSEARRRTIVIDELGALVEKYGHPRRTRIIGADEVPVVTVTAEAAGGGAADDDDVADNPCVVSLSTSGLIGREPQGTARSYSPSRHDVLDGVLVTSLHQPVWAFTSGGKVARTRALELPEVGGRSRGKATNEAFATERADTVLTVTGATGGPLLLVTALGLMKRVEREALADVRPGKPVMTLAPNDRVIAVLETTSDDDVVLVSTDAQALRTPVAGVSVQGPAAKGVAGMALRGTARVIGAGIARDGVIVVTVTDRSTAKVTPVDEIPVKGRGTGGVRLTKFRDEQRIDYAWVGIAERAMCVVGQPGAQTKPDNAPVPLSMRPSRRDGPSAPTASRILAVGSLRW
ncbi:MAG: DNA topoisomerase (ATP-hydrolyzing) [Acidimicrobiales bacterium]